MTTTSITVDDLDYFPHAVEATFNLNVSGVWRIKLAALLIRLAGRLLNSEASIVFVASKEGDGK